MVKVVCRAERWPSRVQRRPRRRVYFAPARAPSRAPVGRPASGRPRRCAPGSSVGRASSTCTHLDPLQPPARAPAPRVRLGAADPLRAVLGDDPDDVLGRPAFPVQSVDRRSRQRHPPVQPASPGQQSCPCQDDGQCPAPCPLQYVSHDRPTTDAPLPGKRERRAMLGREQRGQNRWEDHAGDAAAGTPCAPARQRGPTSRGRPAGVERSRAGDSAERRGGAGRDACARAHGSMSGEAGVHAADAGTAPGRQAPHRPPGSARRARARSRRRCGRARRRRSGARFRVGPDGVAGTNFALWAGGAEAVELCLFDDDGRAETRAAADRADARDLARLRARASCPGQRYGYRVHGRWDPWTGARWNPAKLLLDPYARAVDGDFELPARGVRACARLAAAACRRHRARRPGLGPVRPQGRRRPRRRRLGGRPPPKTPWADSVIYELHVRGFTKLPPRASREELRGTYAGPRPPGGDRAPDAARA